MNELLTFINEETAQFSLGFSVAELSLLPMFSKKEKWFFFNRIKVQRSERLKGVGTQLMQEVVKWADKEKINITCVLNPYDGSTQDRLIDFYSKFNFKIDHKDEFDCLMNRRCNDIS